MLWRLQVPSPLRRALQGEAIVSKERLPRWAQSPSAPQLTTEDGDAASVPMSNEAGHQFDTALEAEQVCTGLVNS